MAVRKFQFRFHQVKLERGWTQWDQAACTCVVTAPRKATFELSQGPWESSRGLGRGLKLPGLHVVPPGLDHLPKLG